MAVRTRTRVLGNSTPGSFVSNTSTGTIVTSQASQVYDRQSCDDTTGPIPYQDHALNLEHRFCDAIVFNGKAQTTTTRWTDYHNYRNRGTYGLAPSVPGVDWSYYRTKALAAMNPSTPTVDVPVFLFELKDFPGMLKELGDVLRKKIKPSQAAGGYLSYSFGWAPLISDLRKLINFSDTVNKRLLYLQKTSAKGGAKVTKTLDTITETLSRSSYSGPVPQQTSIPVCRGTSTVVQTRKVWSVANVASFLSPVQLDDPRRTAARAALGLNLSAASLWEAIPWSWLIDYTGNIGDFLAANRGFIPSRITNLNLMCLDEIVDYLTITETHWNVSISGSGNMLTVSKKRSVSSAPVPSLALRPWFSPHMAGILGSLTTSRALRAIGH